MHLTPKFTTFRRLSKHTGYKEEETHTSVMPFVSTISGKTDQAISFTLDLQFCFIVQASSKKIGQGLLNFGDSGFSFRTIFSKHTKERQQI